MSTRPLGAGRSRNAEWVDWFTTAASTRTAATSRMSNWRRPTTLNTGNQPPAEFSDQKVSGHARRFSCPFQLGVSEGCGTGLVRRR
jgi:hypothetical protein